MRRRHAYIEVTSPDGRQIGVTTLSSNRLTVGRPTPDHRPDVCLEPDPEQWVSRLHCFLENEGGAWWVNDNATPNGTFVSHGEGDPEEVVGRRRLEAGDIIYILGEERPEGLRYWKLTFHDPFGTHRAPGRSVRPSICLEYDHLQVKVFRREGSRRTEVPNLSPKAHQLVRYMVTRSEEAGAPVACTHDELISAVWGDPGSWRHQRSYTRENLRDLISDVRQRLEPDPAKPRLLEAVPGYGYRLVTCPVRGGA